MSIDNVKLLINTVKVFLDSESNISREIILGHIENQCRNPIFASLTVEAREAVFKSLLADYSVWMNQTPTVLSDNTDHIEWLSDSRKEIDWSFWERYHSYLEREKGYPKAVLNELDRTTDLVLSYLEHPKREGFWDRRGMVVGEVQSGKTSNYTGLICKAVDAGYKVIIILAGMHNSLRSQTQIRIDAGFGGRDTRINQNEDNISNRFGAGLLKSFNVSRFVSLTNSSEGGDFKLTTARSVYLELGGDPLVLVVKKNASVLKNLINWLKNQIKTEMGETKINNIPVLLIDDEADNASVDGKAVKRDEYGNPLVDEDPTKINRQIRTILNKFQKSSYVGYTATPFANIFIYPQSNNKQGWGEDLFPRSFIVNLPTPSNYIGPAKVFGLNHEKYDSVPLPIVRIINDYSDFVPDKHRRDHIVPKEMPPSLDTAIKSFIISCAARILRGQENMHNSMLVHVTRFVDVQAQVAALIDSRIRYLRNCLKYNSTTKGDDIWSSFESLWQDYLETTNKINTLLEEEFPIHEWEKVKTVLYDAISKIEVKEINGSAKDALEYNNREETGMYVIAIGGDKLSRGLTLEGLTISYYLRASKMYDTLMQMGRWFGYRPGYADLCRIFTSPELVEWYQYIALASQELREEFNYMDSIGATPEDFGLRVRNHPGVLQITATNKLRNGTKMKVSFKNSLCSTVHFHEDLETINHNLNCLGTFVNLLGIPESNQKHSRWKNAKPEHVISFLKSYKAHPLNTKSEPRRLAEYIESQSERGELLDWSVFLISRTQGNVVTYNLGSISVGLVERARCQKRSGENRYSLSNGQLITERHELLDLNEHESKNAYADYISNSPEKKKRDYPSGVYIRKARPSRRCLLLIYLIKSEIKGDPFVGYAISFPDSSNAAEIEYTVNTTYWSQLYDED